MNKRRKVEVADTTEWLSVTAMPMNWDMRILCQMQTVEPLMCPTPAGYTTLTNNLSKFAELNALPRSINLDNFGDGSGVLATLTKNNAKYHRVCRNKYDEQKLGRLSTPMSVSHCALINTRSSSNLSDIRTCCIFCDTGPTLGKIFISARTKEIGPKIHTQAVEMQDTKLLVKLASTDFIALEVKYHNECYTCFRNSYRSHQRAMGRSEMILTDLRMVRSCPN